MLQDIHRSYYNNRGDDIIIPRDRRHLAHVKYMTFASSLPRPRIQSASNIRTYRGLTLLPSLVHCNAQYFRVRSGKDLTRIAAAWHIPAERKNQTPPSPHPPPLCMWCVCILYIYRIPEQSWGIFQNKDMSIMLFHGGASSPRHSSLRPLPEPDHPPKPQDAFPSVSTHTQARVQKKNRKKLSATESGKRERGGGGAG